MNIIVLDDDPGICKTLQLHFSENHQVKTVDNVATFHRIQTEFSAHLLLIDLKLPDGNGIQLLKSLRKRGNNTPVIIMTGHSDMENPIEAMRVGATDYIQKPLDIEEIEIALTRVQSQIRQNQSLRKLTQDEWQERKIVGHSKTIIAVLKQIGLVSQGKINVHITGESGTGKELVARTIHWYSAGDQPFVAVNCSALAPSLLESELFGHEKGAFTHAVHKHIGRLERSNSGTLFLDEIGELPLEHQVKLLRVLQEREFERVGGNQRIPFHARIISATNRDLQQLVEQKKFREDLYFRLCTQNIIIPPLREHLEDIPELVEYILHKINRELHKKINQIPEVIFYDLQQYSWPGNIRELENVLMRAALLCSGNIFELPRHVLTHAKEKEKPQEPEICSLAQMEQRHIQKILKHVKGNITQASAILDITRTTLRKKIKELEIT